MKRDMDLFREVLLYAESMEGQWFASKRVPEGCKRKKFVYHVGLAINAGFLRGRENHNLQGHDWLVIDLTYEGHEFLDSVRSSSIWDKVKGTAQKQGVELTVGVAMALAIEAAKQKLGLS